MSTVEVVAPVTPKKSLLGDVALAVALAALGVVGPLAAGGDVAGTPLDVFGGALAAGAGLVLALRRRWTLATLAAAAVLTATYLAIGYMYGPILVSLLVAVYTTARRLPLAKSAPAASVTLLLLLIHLFTNSAALPGFYGLIPASAWVVAPFATGLSVRLTREAAARDRAETIRQHVDTERLRVAQEVHDIVGHGLAAIKMQADVALHLREKKPEQMQTALDAISRTSSSALEELRATLAVVRRSDAEQAPSSPWLPRLDELLERMRQAGLQVDLEVAGEASELPAIVDLTCYRVLQESLTNVLRHSGVPQARVRVQHGPETMLLTVSNPIAGGHSDHSGGLGISGMRERVLALGGEFSAGPAGGRRFEVRASLPIGGGA
ncbi:MAG: sensor histidine kinase [Micromonosporaceae bacterium]